MYRFSRLFQLDLFNLLQNPMWVFYCMAFPILMVLILGFLTSGGYGSPVSSYDYYGITMMIYVVFNAATISANSFLEERIKSGNMRMIYSPIRPVLIPFSKMLASFVFVSGCHLAAALVLHYAVGVNFGGADAGYILIILLFSEFFAAALGVMLCCALKSEGITNQILSLATTLLAVLGGLFFPLDGYGPTLRALSRISPIQWVSSAAFRLIYDHDFSGFLPACAVLAALSVLLIGLCIPLFRTEDYL